MNGPSPVPVARKMILAILGISSSASSPAARDETKISLPS